MSRTLQLEEMLNRTEHRPYPLPKGTGAISMSWHDLLFMHWSVPYDALRSLILPALSLDTFDDDAWLAVVPFRMSGVRPRFLPGVPWLSDFPELNLRTYVTVNGRPGVWFFSLDAHNPVAVRLARTTFFLPYYDARMTCRISGGEVHYVSVRTHRNAPKAAFRGSYRPAGEPLDTGSGTLEYFLTERYCLYSADRRSRIWRGDIHHAPWPLQPAEAEIPTLQMTGQIGLEHPDTEPILHFSKRLDMLAWAPRRIDA